MYKCLKVRKGLEYLRYKDILYNCSWSKISKLDKDYSGVMRTVKTH